MSLEWAGLNYFRIHSSQPMWERLRWLARCGTKIMLHLWETDYLSISHFLFYTISLPHCTIFEQVMFCI